MTNADRIKQRRLELGMTQEELAKKMGYSSKSAVSRTENSGNDIGFNRIVKFAEALYTTPSYIMGLDNNDDKNNGWIPVKDKLPPTLELVVALTKNYEVCLTHLSDNGNFIVHDTVEDMDFIMPVIAWCSLPEIHEEQFL